MKRLFSGIVLILLIIAILFSNFGCISYYEEIGDQGGADFAALAQILILAAMAQISQRPASGGSGNVAQDPPIVSDPSKFRSSSTQTSSSTGDGVIGGGGGLCNDSH
jgi:hypothetical protein